VTTTYDVIVIGSGHNGLVCGAYLAKSGLKTLVLERRENRGWRRRHRRVHPGFRASRFSYVMSLFAIHASSRIWNSTHLGWKYLPANDLFCPLGADNYIVFSDDIKKTQAEFARFSRHDAEIYPQFARYLEESAAVVRQLLFETRLIRCGAAGSGFKKSAALLWRSSHDWRWCVSDDRPVDSECVRLSVCLVRARHDQMPARVLRLDRHLLPARSPPARHTCSCIT